MLRCGTSLGSTHYGSNASPQFTSSTELCNLRELVVGSRKAESDLLQSLGSGQTSLGQCTQVLDTGRQRETDLLSIGGALVRQRDTVNDNGANLAGTLGTSHSQFHSLIQAHSVGLIETGGQRARAKLEHAALSNPRGVNKRKDLLSGVSDLRPGLQTDRRQIKVNILQNGRKIGGREPLGEINNDVGGAVGQSMQQLLVNLSGRHTRRGTEGLGHAPTNTARVGYLRATDKREDARLGGLLQFILAGIQRIDVDAVIGCADKLRPHIQRDICDVLLLHTSEHTRYCLVPSVVLGGQFGQLTRGSRLVVSHGGLLPS